MTLNPTQRKQLLERHGSRCAYCGIDLSASKWHADHVEPVMRESRWAKDKNGRTIMVATGKLYHPERDHAGNLMPACVPCNIDKGGCDLEGWRNRLTTLADNLRRNSSTFRHAERFLRVSINPDPVVFWFETQARQL